MIEVFKMQKLLRLGFAITGSFCTHAAAIEVMAALTQSGVEITPILSPSSDTMDTKFGTALELKQRINSITSTQIITTITQAEPIGPRKLFDALLILPATGNTVAKIANGITDTAVTMASKSHLRNNRPVVIAVSSNDALGAGAKNIGLLLNTKNIFFVPFGQDNALEKPRSMVFDKEYVLPAIKEALNGQQIQPLLRNL